MKLLPFDYAVRNLGRSGSRLALTVAGSALVVLLVITSGAFVRGMGASLRVSGSEHNVILLGAGSEESVERSEIPASSPGVLAASVVGIRQRAGTMFVSPQVHVMLPVGPAEDGPARGGHSGHSGPAGGRQALVRGVTPEAFLVHEAARITEGRFPARGSDEVITGRMAATTLGVPESAVAVGSSLDIDGRRWRIVGRFSAPGTVMDGEVWTTLDDIMEATKRTTISCVVVTLGPGEAEFADVAAFTKMRPDLELAAIAEREYYSRLAGFFRPIRIVAWTTAGLIGLGGLFGGLNTMYAAFASRVRELGTLRSLGFRRWAILTSLVQESVLATTAGSLGACAVAVLLLDGAGVRFSMGAFALIVDTPVVLAGMGAGLVLGLFGALPPGVKCLRPPIPEALKAV